VFVLFFGLTLSGYFNFGLRLSGLLDEFLFTVDPFELEFDLVGLLYLAELLDLPRPPPPPPPLGIALIINECSQPLIIEMVGSTDEAIIFTNTLHPRSPVAKGT